MKLFTVADAVVADAGALKANDRAELERRFDHLLAANGAAFRRLAATYTRTAGDRDDLLQEIALAIWKALPGFRGECSERTFVFRIAHNRSVAYLARAHSRTAASVEEVDVRDPTPNVETELAQEQRATRLRRVIQRLPLSYQQVISLMLEGLEYAEIAAILGISETNVGARLTRARQMLRAELESAG